MVVAHARVGLGAMNQLSPQFWQYKTLAEMTTAEWEALCDGCGKCCLHKLVEEVDVEPGNADDGLYVGASERLYYTDIRCEQLDSDSGQCRCYAQRLETVASCVNITLADLPRIHFMPGSCAYRRLHEGRSLPDWHPLLHNGSQAPMLAARQSVRSHPTISERDIDEDDFELRIVTWPLD